jgi:hypothetical protein
VLSEKWPFLLDDYRGVCTKQPLKPAVFRFGQCVGIPVELSDAVGLGSGGGLSGRQRRSRLGHRQTQDEGEEQDDARDHRAYRGFPSRVEALGDYPRAPQTRGANAKPSVNPGTSIVTKPTANNPSFTGTRRVPESLEPYEDPIPGIWEARESG